MHLWNLFPKIQPCPSRFSSTFEPIITVIFTFVLALLKRIRAACPAHAFHCKIQLLIWVSELGFEEFETRPARSRQLVSITGETMVQQTKDYHIRTHGTESLLNTLMKFNTASEVDIENKTQISVSSKVCPDAGDNKKMKQIFICFPLSDFCQ